ncbi:DDE-type integrase/transposase/recombinase [Thioclava sp.]|uniref:DDE-type integrase/transposase/recombinase n=1 Tax=Thioclava sp. TaxID=1933450 RepID=UPI003AA8EFAA
MQDHGFRIVRAFEIYRHRNILLLVCRNRLSQIRAQSESPQKFATVPVKYLNNIVEQDHRFIKRITRPMMGFKAFHSAQATIAGIEVAHMIQKGQIPANGAGAFQTFADLAA